MSEFHNLVDLWVVPEGTKPEFLNERNRIFGATKNNEYVLSRQNSSSIIEQNTNRVYLPSLDLPYDRGKVLGLIQFWISLESEFRENSASGSYMSKFLGNYSGNDIENCHQESMTNAYGCAISVLSQVDYRSSYTHVRGACIHRDNTVINLVTYMRRFQVNYRLFRIFRLIATPMALPLMCSPSLNLKFRKSMIFICCESIRTIEGPRVLGQIPLKVLGS